MLSRLSLPLKMSYETKKKGRLKKNNLFRLSAKTVSATSAVPLLWLWSEAEVYCQVIQKGASCMLVSCKWAMTDPSCPNDNVLH